MGRGWLLHAHLSSSRSAGAVQICSSHEDSSWTKSERQGMDLLDGFKLDLYIIYDLYIINMNICSFWAKYCRRIQTNSAGK